MEQDVTFSEPVSVGDAMGFLPYNYLPAALPAISGGKSLPNRIVMTFQPQSAMPKEGAGRYTAISAEVLKSPKETAEFIKKLQGKLDFGDEDQVWFLGPPTTLDHNTNDTLLTLPLKTWSPIEDAEFDAAVVVIDAGIAFWNRRFQGPDGPRFLGIKFLSFDEPPGGQLEEAEIQQLIQSVEEGEMTDRQVVQYLGEQFDYSFFGSPAAKDLDGIWHGTAMADLAAGLAAGDVDATRPKVALFGIELPTAMVQDYSGDSLSFSLLAILEVAIRMTAGTSKDVTILLPFGFSGPPDRTHPAAKAIEKFLALHPKLNLKIVVSAGNLLQSRLRARLPGTPPNTPPLKLDWWEAPDDFSVNTVEALINDVDRLNGRASLDVKAPTNETASKNGLVEGQWRNILRSGTIIGSMVRFKNKDNTARLRISLMPTGHRDSEVTAPHGRWTLSTPSSQPADLWMLRDDRDQLFDQEYPHRQSHFDHQMYRPTDKLGAAKLTDDGASPVLRSGTISPLATADGVDAVQANERLGDMPERLAEYSGEPGNTALRLHRYLVDDGYAMRGVPASVNGSDRRMRVSGTSSAAALHVRSLIGFGGPPEL